MPTGHYIRTIKPKTIHVPIGPSIAYVPLTKGLFALIDREDCDAVGLYNWYAHRNWPYHRAELYYAKRKPPIGERKKRGEVQCLHEYLLKLHDVDHFNRRPLDNRRCNLRPSDRSEQAFNTSAHCDSKSGHKNIGARGDGRWSVSMMVQGKVYRYGTYDTLEEAIAVRDSVRPNIHSKPPLCPPKPKIESVYETPDCIEPWSEGGSNV
jgi:hypothetical protein